MQPLLVPTIGDEASRGGPLGHGADRKLAVNTQIGIEARKNFGTIEALRDVADAYFESVALRVPIVSKRKFYDRFPMDLTLNTPADFALLCLCMHLIQHPPGAQAGSMQSPLYINVKSMISLLEATCFQSLEFVQCRLIVAFYEMGHGIYPAASISLGACARLARGIRLHKDRNELPEKEPARLEAEEKRRVWWAIVNLDRYVGFFSSRRSRVTSFLCPAHYSVLIWNRFINICGGDGLFASDDPKVSDLLPFGDRLWSQGVGYPHEYTHRDLSAPADVTIGQFARECQASHLTGRVLKHVFDPLTSDAAFNAQAASQLERTLMSLIPLLMDEEIRFGKYCAALGMCTRNARPSWTIKPMLTILVLCTLSTTPRSMLRRMRLLCNLKY